MRATATQFQWGDDVHVFDLKLGQVRELEDKCKAGVFVVLGRLFGRTCSYDDIRETIRLGLIGGGKTPSQAWQLVTRYVDERPIAESLPVAMAIIAGLAHGAPEETADEANPQSAAPATAESTSPPSMEAPPSSASSRAPSINSQFGNGARSSTAGTKRMAVSPKPSRRRSKSTMTELQG